jgi:hypothetical protein
MPASDVAAYDGYYNTTPECWSIYTEVLGVDFGNPVVFRQVHQLTVDTYAVQHAGGSHPDKSIVIHLCGLHLVLDRDHAPTGMPQLFQRLAATVEDWPHFPPPADMGPVTAFDVALSQTPEAHIENVRAWAKSVWGAWRDHHAAVAAFVESQLALD